MIKNERQYRITKAHVQKFAHALDQLAQSHAEEKHVHPILLRAEQEALRSQLADLRTELEEYEALQSGRRSIPRLQSFVDLPRDLIRARIAKGLTQKGLAERLGLKEQQIQKYEATEYASASLSRVREVAEALGVMLADDSIIRPSRTSLASLINRLKEAGLDRDLVMKRLVPAPLSGQLRAGNVEGIDNLVYQVAAHVGRIFGWTPHDILESGRLQLNTKLAAAKLKVTAQANEQRVNVYLIYAHYLALTILQAVKSQVQKPAPTDPYETRAAILSRYGPLTLSHVLQYLWDLGIPVLPLNAPSAFHGACFRENGRNMIVIKQKTSSSSRWMFDALHETYHTLQEPKQPNLVVIEHEDMSQQRLSSNQETTASQYAGAVLLGKSPQRLAELCLEESNRDLRMLKLAVQRVASTEDVPVASLANYMAFRLSLEGHNWWGTAANLQEGDSNPFSIARDILLGHVDLSKLADPDLQLLQRALGE